MSSDSKKNSGTELTIPYVTNKYQFRNRQGKKQMDSKPNSEMSDTAFTRTASDCVAKLRAAKQELLERKEFTFRKLDEFNPSPTNAISIRAHAIQKLLKNQQIESLTEYLRGLGYVRKQIITARAVLNAEGKKRYETYIKSSTETLSLRFVGLKAYYLNILTGIMDIPFKRSADKDRRQISDSLCQIADLIIQYRYCGEDDRYRDYARTIIGNINTGQLPPMIARLIIQETTALVDTACIANVLAYVSSGITHEEYWRYGDPDEYAEVYPGCTIPEEAIPLNQMDEYASHQGIARQSLWYGHDFHIDDFIVSLVGGLLYAKSPS